MSDVRKDVTKRNVTHKYVTCSWKRALVVVAVTSLTFYQVLTLKRDVTRTMVGQGAGSSRLIPPVFRVWNHTPHGVGHGSGQGNKIQDPCFYDLHGNEVEQFYSLMRTVSFLFTDHTAHDQQLNFTSVVKMWQTNSKAIKDYMQKWNQGLLWKSYKRSITNRTCDVSNDVIITITETSKNRPTSGGSSFTLLSTSAHTRDFCPVLDLFNGTYIARCAVHETNMEISGRVRFINFTAYSNLQKRLGRQLFKINVNPRKNVTEGGRGGNVEDTNDTRGYWLVRNKTWDWLESGHVIPEVNRTRMRLCHDKSRITFLGDSHTRYWCYYFLKQLNQLPVKLPEKLHGDFRSGNIHFRWGPYVETLVKKLKNQIEELNQETMDELALTNKTGTMDVHSAKLTPTNKTDTLETYLKNERFSDTTVFVFNALVWDVGKDRVAEYLSGIHALRDLVAQWRGRGRGGFRFVYLTTVTASGRRDAAPRNTFLGRVLSQLALREMRRLGVETIDVGEMLWAVQDKDVEHGHYLRVIPNSGRVVGDHAAEVAKKIIHTICRD